ncbi:RNA polymerase II elongation factor ELL-like isoform X2 [Parambassis ranga]|uniref:RNA polymerase II elongation factor ELL-like isoform X2 n=1 Tax=Parambassis ranga TaxID=210632 RepID=A0A6P7HIW4_9TELE|nr:RNA polymerase II elongation factor ELL-like isoform X2 [Parambassis ranga]
MSALKENQCYGLSSGKLCRGGKVSVLHVKLTDSAARAIETFQNCKGLSTGPTICFSGNQGRITIPLSQNRDEVKTFTFGVTNVARDNPHGSFDCVKQLSSGAAEELSCLGVIQKKMTVNATDDSYDKARQSMAQAEEKTRQRGAIVIKHGGRYQVKKVTVRPPAPALASLTKPKPQSLIHKIKKGVAVSSLKNSACTSSRTSAGVVQDRPLRERVAHLLALRPYKRPELILRLQSDGLTAKDKDQLNSVLTQVGQLNSRDNTYVLKDSLYKELQKDWPGYTSADGQLLTRILVRRLFQPQQDLLAVPEAQVSPLRDTPNSSPAHRPKHSLPEEYTDPLVSKKPRISHLSSKMPSDKSRSQPSEQTAHEDEAAVEDKQRNTMDPKGLSDSLSAVCQQQEAEVAQGLRTSDPVDQDRPEGDQPQTDHPPSSLTVPDLERHATKRKKSKHKHKHRDHNKDGCPDKKERRKDGSSEEPHCTGDDADYLSKYTVISSHSQRQSYKQDFNKEYSEYRELHSRIGTVTQQFMDLDTQLKQLHHESQKYKTVHNQILQEFRKIKKSNPNYNQDKGRCEYLHNKLAHIKKLISEYDQQQLRVDSP